MKDEKIHYLLVLDTDLANLWLGDWYIHIK